jgi:hypothetical protein
LDKFTTTLLMLRAAVPQRQELPRFIFGPQGFQELYRGPRQIGTLRFHGRASPILLQKISDF